MKNQETTRGKGRSRYPGRKRLKRRAAFFFSVYLILAGLFPASLAAGPQQPDTGGFMKVGNISMYYEVLGQGEPLLLIMGLGGHSLDWGWTLPKKLAEGYEVIVFDNRGSGRTDQPPGPYSISQMAEDAVGLMDGLGIERAHVFGVSMGGMIAQQIALDHPDRVDRLILGCTSAGGRTRVQATPEIQAYLVPRLDLSPHDALLWAAPACYPQEFIDSNPEVVERKIQANLAHPGGLQAYMAQLEAYGSHDVYDRLGSILAPTQLIVGDRDVLIPPANSYIMADQIQDSRVVEIVGAGHLFWISHPGETLSAVTEFLG